MSKESISDQSEDQAKEKSRRIGQLIRNKNKDTSYVRKVKS